MLSRITEFFRSLDDTRDTGPVTDKRLAAAVLMLEVAQADHKEDPAELAALVDRLVAGFGLSREDVEALLDNARQAADHSVSLTQHVAALNNRMETREKEGLLRDLWRVAYCDGELHHYEEHLIRRIAELLYLPHNVYIRTKLEAAAELER